MTSKLLNEELTSLSNRRINSSWAATTELTDSDQSNAMLRHHPRWGLWSCPGIRNRTRKYDSPKGTRLVKLGTNIINTNTHKTSRYFENHTKYFKLLCKLYFTGTWVISNAECIFNRLSEFREIKFPLHKVIRQSVTSFNLRWNKRCSYCCVFCLLRGRFVQKKNVSYCVVLPRTYVIWKKIVKKYPRQHCRVEEHKVWKIWKCTFRAEEKKGTKFCVGTKH